MSITVDSSFHPQSTRAATEKPPEQLMNRTSSRSLSFYKYCHKQRLWICGLIAILTILGMAAGVVFTAHHYYQSWGGQGFLKTRDLLAVRKISHSQLPFRKVAKHLNGIDELDLFGIKRAPKNPPFYMCGDQQHSCEAFDQPNICCLAGMRCQASTVTTSQILCCNSTVLNQPCEPDPSNPPQCPQSTFECAYLVGGGCCPDNAQCSPNGCIAFEGDLSPHPITSTYTITSTSTIASEDSNLPAGVSNASNEAGRVTLLSTGTMIMGGPVTPTATTVKDGEVAQKGDGAQVVKFGQWLESLSQPPLALLVGVAIWMALL